jgi:putative NADPH-quinone reductase
MSTLVVHAHPLEESYSAALRDAVRTALAESNIKFTLARIAQDEEPILDGVTHLIAVYPTWWGGLPAALLDWVQRLLVPLVDEGSTDQSPFASVERISVVTTHGSSQLMNHLQGQPGKQTWTRVVLTHCAPGAEFEWVALYKIDRSTDGQRQAFLDHVGSHFTTAPVPS